jgi:hypothetical protein
MEREIRESLVFFLDILQAITITTLPIKSLSWKRSSCWRWQNLHKIKKTNKNHHSKIPSKLPKPIFSFSNTKNKQESPQL